MSTNLEVLEAELESGSISAVSGQDAIARLRGWQAVKNYGA